MSNKIQHRFCKSNLSCFSLKGVFATSGFVLSLGCLLCISQHKSLLGVWRACFFNCYLGEVFVLSLLDFWKRKWNDYKHIARRRLGWKTNQKIGNSSPLEDWIRLKKQLLRVLTNLYMRNVIETKCFHQRNFTVHEE